MSKKSMPIVLAVIEDGFCSHRVLSPAVIKQMASGEILFWEDLRPVNVKVMQHPVDFELLDFISPSNVWLTCGCVV